MENKNLFRIGEVAKMFHLSVSSLRHYENIGLLSPEYISQESGYRYYSAEQFEILNTIRYLRALDMPLSEIEEFLADRDIDYMEEKLRQQKEIVIQKQQELQRIERKIEHRLQWISDAQSIALNEVMFVNLPECKIVWVDHPIKIEGYLDMEVPIRQLDQSDVEAVVFLGKVGVGISQEHLQARTIKNYDGAFLILDQEDIYSGKTTTLPATSGLRIRFRGSHTEAANQYKILFKYIEKNALEITGFSREVTLIDYGITKNQEKFVTEICIPVRKRGNNVRTNQNQ